MTWQGASTENQERDAQGLDQISSDGDRCAVLDCGICFVDNSEIHLVYKNFIFFFESSELNPGLLHGSQVL